MQGSVSERSHLFSFSTRQDDFHKVHTDMYKIYMRINIRFNRFKYIGKNRSVNTIQSWQFTSRMIRISNIIKRTRLHLIYIISLKENMILEENTRVYFTLFFRFSIRREDFRI